MSVFDVNVSARFYLTASQPCPYLPGREERKVFTTLRGAESAEVHHALSLRGFRRSQNVAYRPSCVGCSSCLSVRTPVERFSPGRSQRRTLRRNADLTRDVCAPWATEEQFALFSTYLASRHADGGMSEMGGADFSAMVEQSPVSTRVVEYRLKDAQGREKLVAACLTDVTPDGLSMVYSFYDPTLTARSLGVYMILDHIALARGLGLPHLYLGYWVPGSAKMTYKARFRPFEAFVNGAWREVESDAPPDAPRCASWPVAPL